MQLNWIWVQSKFSKLNSNTLNEIQILLNWIEILKLNQAQYSFSMDSTGWMFPLKLNWIEFSWIESYWIRFNTHWLNLFKLIWIQPNYENSITKKTYVNLPFHVIHVTRIEMKVDFKKQLETIQGSRFYNNLIDHIKRYCCWVSKHKPKPQNPILFLFLCLLH
jgi:hypothetical protein